MKIPRKGNLFLLQYLWCFDIPLPLVVMTLLLDIIFAGCVLAQFLIWIGLYSRLAFYKPSPCPAQKDFPISIIICGYNEADNFERNLPAILNQKYHEFEVLVIDDASTDGSMVVLEKLKAAYPQLRILQKDYPEGKKYPGKKQALAFGIREAKYDHVLLTDADCLPCSSDWIRLMSRTFQFGASIGLGYSPYKKTKGWLNRFIRFETTYTAIQYLSFSLAGIPYMGVGRNLTYDRRLFFANQGFKSHEHITSGDDDLFINEVATEKNTDIIIDRKGWTVSPAKETLGEYFRQKNRHMTTGVHYKWNIKLLLGISAFSHFGAYIFALPTILFGNYGKVAIILLLVLLLVKGIVFFIISKKLDVRDLALSFLFWDIIYILYFIIFSPALLKGNTNSWK